MFNNVMKNLINFDSNCVIQFESSNKIILVLVFQIFYDGFVFITKIQKHLQLYRYKLQTVNGC